MMVKYLVIVGISKIAVEISRWAVSQGINVTVIANKSQWSKLFDKKSFFDSLKDENVKQISLENLDDFDNALIPDVSKSLFISIGAPWIFKVEHLKIFSNKLLNLHGTRLPKDRGGTLHSWQILNGLKTGMNLLHKMNIGIDEGPVVAFEEYIIPASCRLPKDHIDYYQKANITFLKEFIASYNGELHLIGQPEYLSSYWPRLRADVHGWINWSWDSQNIERFICAFDDPYDGARCSLNRTTVIIRNAWAQSTDGRSHPFQNGLVYRNNGKWITVAAHDGEILIETIEDLAGNSLLGCIKPGDRLYTTSLQLEESVNRVIKTSEGLVVKEHN